MALTEKMKRFAREYYKNGGNGTDAYITAYDTENRVTASREAHELLKRDDIKEYLITLNKPQEKQAITEREKKRSILWERIRYCMSINDDTAVARYMDILNKMDSEYKEQQTINDNKTVVNTLDLETLKALTK